VKFSNAKDILQFAIQREEEAARGYGELAARTKNDGSKTLLLELRADEQKHKKVLQDLAEGEAAPPTVRKVADLKISDYLIEEPLGEKSDFQALLIFAAKKEAKAVELYTQLLNRSANPEHKRLFEFLVRQEQSHKLRLEQEYEKQVLPED
jgi:rubrerythrin